ncbi:MAG: RdgB/HAM1 family non-canonical purine NTP pyrophosphatase [Anaerolineales bacterium]
MPQILLIATNNPGKLREFQTLLVDLPLQLRTPAQIGLALDVDETGSTYHQNAAIKARAFSAASGLPCLADDSGIELDALNGAPGVYSARLVTTPGATDADRRAALLAQLQPHPQPWAARFRCVLAIAAPNTELYFAEGVCEGQIIPTARGDNGFGYDPIFFLPELNQTMAELPEAEKNRRSHRARAVQAAHAWLRAFMATGAG